MRHLLLLLSHFSRVRLCATPETAAHQTPPSLGFSRQEHWSGLPFPSPMHESEKIKWSRSVVSDSYQPHGLQPTRPFRPWDFPGKSTGVGCHCLLRSFHICIIKRCVSSCLGGMYTKIGMLQRLALTLCKDDTNSWRTSTGEEVEKLEPSYTAIQFSSVTQSCPTLCNPKNHSMPGLPVHHQLLELTQTHIHRVSDAIQPSHPLSSPSPPAPNPSQHQGLFQWVSSSC